MNERGDTTATAAEQGEQAPCLPPITNHQSPITPSPTRAWLALVWLSFRRQARSRQMVWIAIGLLAFSVAFVAIHTAARGWGKGHWRAPRRGGQTYTEWVWQTQAITGLVHRTAGAHAVEHAFLGSCQVILTKDGTDTQGRLLSVSGFQVFSGSIVFLLFLTFLLPFWSLSFATESLGGERENQSLIWLLSRPLPRPAIYLAKFVALLPWVLGLNLGGFALLCLAAGPPGRLALSLYWSGVAWATIAFAALYLLIGAYFRRPAIVAITYSFCLEVVLGLMPGYVKRVSLGFYVRCLMFERAEQFGMQPDNPDIFLPVSGTTALIVLMAATVGLLGLGMWLFSRTQYHEVD